jgi:WD40 repeat protein
VDRGRELRTLKGHSSSVDGVAVSAGGRRAVSTSGDKTPKAWDLTAGSLLTTFACDGAATPCGFVDHCRLIAGDRGGRLYFLILIQ